MIRSRLRPSLFCIAFTYGCTPEAQPREAADVSTPSHRERDAVAGVSSARTPWVAARPPDDLALIEVPARVVGEAAAHADIGFVYTARVLDVHVRAGDRVEKGDPLVDLSVPELTKAAAVVRGTSAEIELQRQRRDELDRLRSRGLVGTREVFAVDARLAELEADHAVAASVLAAAGTDGRNALRNGRYRLVAPTSGVVMAINASPGEVRDPNDGPFVSLVAEGPARVEVSLARPLPPDADLVFLGQDGRSIQLASQPVSMAIEPEGGMTRAWFVPRDEALALPHGLRGRMRVQGAAEDLLQVPTRALRLHGDGQALVVVRTEDGDTKEVAVEVVTRSGSSTLVRSERLNSGDLVASDAAVVLDAASENGD